MAPKLSKNSCLPLLFFINKNKKVQQLEFYDQHRLLIKTLMISQKFLQTFCEKDDDGEKKKDLLHSQTQLNFAYYDITFKREWIGRYDFELSNLYSSNVLPFLLQMVKLKELDIVCFIGTPAFLHTQNIQEWALVFRALKANKSLQKLNVQLNKAHLPSHQCFLEMLLMTNKVSTLKVDSKVGPLLKGQINKNVMDCVRVEILAMDSYLTPIFQAKTRKIEFDRESSWGLWDLVDCGPFKPNPHLEVIEIHARLDLQLEYKESFLDKSWDEKYLEKYAKILKQLKQLNPNLRLRLHDKETSLDKVTNFNDAYQKVSRLIRNTKKFIDLAHENGIQVEYVFLRNVGLVPLNFRNSFYVAFMLGLKKIFGLTSMKEMKNDRFKKAWQSDFLHKLAQKLDLNVHYDDLIGTYVYQGALIEFKQIFIFKHDEI